MLLWAFEVFLAYLILVGKYQIRFDNEMNYVKLQLILLSRFDETEESEYNDEEGDEEDEKNEVDKENPKYIHIYAWMYLCFIV